VKSWDSHQVPKPGSVVAVAIGAPIEVQASADEAAIEQGRLAVETALVELEGRAVQMLHDA
jgi:lysophospholipid acyltransferase (LPLAT)-like uncharacterized protein